MQRGPVTSNCECEHFCAQGVACVLASDIEALEPGVSPKATHR